MHCDCKLEMVYFLSLALLLTLACTVLTHAENPLDSAKFGVGITNPLYAVITGLEEQPFFLGELERQGLNYNALKGKIYFNVIANGSISLTANIGGPFMQAGPIASGQYYIPLEARVRRESDNSVVIGKMGCEKPGDQATGTGTLVGPMNLGLYFDIEAHAQEVGGIENLVQGEYETTFSITVAAP